MASFPVNDGTGFAMNYEIHPGLAPENVLFIHGNLASNRWWYPAEEVRRRKAKGKDWQGSVVYAEFRGCGQSSAPGTEAEVDLRIFARDFISLVRHLNIGPVHVVGHSTGALIAALMMTMEPELFRKGVFLDPVGARGVTFDPSMITAFDRMKTDKDLVATVMGTTIRGSNPADDFFRQVVVEDAFSAVKVVGHLVLKALDGLDVRKELATLDREILVMHGDLDEILPLADSYELAQLLPKSHFELLRNHGHSMNVEDPAGFVEKVDRFLF